MCQCTGQVHDERRNNVDVCVIYQVMHDTECRCDKYQDRLRVLEVNNKADSAKFPHSVEVIAVDM